MLRRFFPLSLLALVLVLAGCATEVPLPSGSRDYRETLTLSGRLSVSYRQSGKAEAVQGKFHWAQQRDRIDIELFSPLGQTIARIAIVPGRARIEQSNGEIREAPGVDALTEDVLGWALPVAGMRYWLQGFTRDAGQRLRAVPAGEPAQLRGDGWQVNYVSWQDGGGYALPKRIDFTRDTAGDTAATGSRGPLALRIVIDGWKP